MQPLIRTIDSHTQGEPTRVVVEGMPRLCGATMVQRRDELQCDWDHLRTAITAEPRACDGTVVAFLTDAVSDNSVAGVVFANRVGYLGMCGHGAIGVAHTFAHLGRIAPERRRFALDTPAGTIGVELFDDASVEIQNVESRAYRLDVAVNVPGAGEVVGDIAYGGNWFFLMDSGRIEPQEIPRLMRLAQSIREALRAQGITGEDGATIDHIELFGAPRRPDADSTNFVLCPDGAYDRSPCGTGTSAKLAVLSARSALRPGDVWRQESITGGLFAARIELRDGHDGVVPFIRGRAHVNGETTLYFDPEDPLRYGLRSAQRQAR